MNNYIDYGENWHDVALQVKRRDNFTCQKCFRSFPANTMYLNVHHILPLSKGGTNAPDNLVTVCLDCHKSFHKHMQEQKKKENKKYKPLKK